VRSAGPTSLGSLRLGRRGRRRRLARPRRASLPRRRKAGRTRASPRQRRQGNADLQRLCASVRAQAIIDLRPSHMSVCTSAMRCTAPCHPSCSCAPQLRRRSPPLYFRCQPCSTVRPWYRQGTRRRPCRRRRHCRRLWLCWRWPLCGPGGGALGGGGVAFVGLCGGGGRGRVGVLGGAAVLGHGHCFGVCLCRRDGLLRVGGGGVRGAVNGRLVATVGLCVAADSTFALLWPRQ